MLSIDDVRSILGPAAYEHDSVLIYQGDCSSLMEQLPPESVQLTVTSPPYNIGKEYESPLPLHEYLSWCENWMAGVHRLTTANGAFWLNIGYVPVTDEGKAVPLAYMLWDKTPFFMLQEVVWTYGAGVSTRKTFAPRNEKLLWYVKDPNKYTFNLDDVRDPDVKYPNQKKNGKLKCNPLGKNPGDVWAIPKVTSGAGRSSVERMPHPAQFPEALIERVILASTNPGDLVLDPFMGSGTTAAVARRLGRNVVGFELRSDYIETTATRLQRLNVALDHEQLSLI